MEHFVTLERAIACPQASATVAAETAAHVLTSAGYRRGLGFGPTASYVRAYRPVWAVVLAVIGAIPTVGLSLLLLRVRSRDHCNVVIEDGGSYGVVALVSGRVPANLPTALESASGQYVQPSEPGGFQDPPPMLLAPPPGQESSPSHTPQAILRPATPVPPMNQAGDLGRLPPEADAGYGASRQHPAPPPDLYPASSFDPYPAPAPDLYPAPPPNLYPASSSDPYPAPQYGLSPGGAPDWAQIPGQAPDTAPPPAEIAPPAGPVRPPSRLAPPMPPDPGLLQPAAYGESGGTAPPPPAPAGEEDLFSSTSGRVPWVGGGRPGPLPAPPGVPSPSGPAPVSPISRPPGFPLAAPTPQPEPPSPFPPSGGHPSGGHPAIRESPGRSGRSGRPGQPAVPGQPGGPDTARQPGTAVTAVSDVTPMLRVDTGEVLELGPFCLLGREPVVRDGDPEAQLVRFEDPKLSVSKTHLAYGVDVHGIWVMDRNSTNGTTVIDPSGRRTPCVPGNRQYLAPGYQVQIGQRRITVEAPGVGVG